MGKFEIRTDAGTVAAADWSTAKTADLVRLLASRAGEPVAVGTLIDTFWPLASPERARASLRTAIHSARRRLGPDRLLRSATGLTLRVDEVDLFAFRAAAAGLREAVRTGRTIDPVEVLRTLAFYRGDVHAADDEAGWIRTLREQVRLEHRDAMRDAADLLLRSGRPGYADLAVDVAGQVLDADPYCERSVRAILHGCAASGQIARAFRFYPLWAGRLAAELGVAPSGETAMLYVGLLRRHDPDVGSAPVRALVRV